MTIDRTRRRLSAAGAAVFGGAAVWPSAQADENPDSAGSNVLRILFEAPETGFDPVQVSDLYSQRVCAHVFEALLGYDPVAVPVRLVPLTAEAMPEFSADFRVWTVRLRKGTLFADDPAFRGQPRELVAADVVYSFKRAFDPATKSPFYSSLNEEGIVGRAVGMALAGLLPVPEIQFRKYAEPATEQINDCGTMRWRTHNRFVAPMVLRVPGGFFKCGDPWHSQTNEVAFVHSPGWKVAVPSNAEDAVGLLRGALRGHDPVLFFEHRAMLDDVWARRLWPGDAFVLPFGKARRVREGDAITIVTWGAMVPRCEAAAEGVSADVLDLRTLMPWDREGVLDSVRRTRRCLIVHEDLRTGGFGAEIAAVVADEAFLDLDAPVARVTMPDIPSPHHPTLLEWALPSVARIRAEIDRLVGF